MSYLERWLGWPKPPPAPLPVEPGVAARTEPQKVKYHVNRFAEALGQCTNDAKRPELERNLAYWQAIAAANAALEGDA